MISLQNVDGKLTIGVLALQGGFSSHEKMLKKLNVNTLQVRHSQDLETCHGLILPGGESTTIAYLINKMGLRESLNDFARSKPLFGTCCGMIIMSKEGWIDIAVERNAYGRQNDSFHTQLEVILEEEKKQVDALFIRAPKILSYASDVTPLAFFNDQPVLIEHNQHFAASFHPELTNDSTIHNFFIKKVERFYGCASRKETLRKDSCLHSC